MVFAMFIPHHCWGCSTLHTLAHTGAPTHTHWHRSMTPSSRIFYIKSILWKLKQMWENVGTGGVYYMSFVDLWFTDSGLLGKCYSVTHVIGRTKYTTHTTRGASEMLFCCAHPWSEINAHISMSNRRGILVCTFALMHIYFAIEFSNMHVTCVVNGQPDAVKNDGGLCLINIFFCPGVKELRIQFYASSMASHRIVVATGWKGIVWIIIDCKQMSAS